MAARRKKQPPYTPMAMPAKKRGWYKTKDDATFHGELVRISIHRHIDWPGKWVVSTSQSGHHDKEVLKSTELDEAVTEGLEVVRKRFRAFVVDGNNAAYELWQGQVHEV